MSELISNNSIEYDAIMARSKAGEFNIASMAIGETNGQWIFETYPADPKHPVIKAKQKAARKIRGYFAAAAAEAPEQTQEAALEPQEQAQAAPEAPKASESPEPPLTPPEPVADLKRAPRNRVNVIDPALDRIPPHSLEAEQGVLGCILLSPRDCLGLCVEKIKPETFYDLRHKSIYEMMLEMDEAKIQIDTITLQQRLKDKRLLDSCGGLAFLSALPDSVPSAANLDYYLEIIKAKHLLRRTLLLCFETEQKCYEDESNALKLVADFETAALQIARVQTADKTTREYVEIVQEQIEQFQSNKGKLSGLSTGFSELDWRLLGLNPGQLYVIGGRTSTGKTSLGMNIADSIAIDQKQPVGIFSLEMTAESLILRMMCARAEVDSMDVRRGQLDDEQMQKLSRASLLIRKAPIHIKAQGSLSVEALGAIARRMVHDHGIKIGIVDYLQRMTSTRRRKSDNREREVALVSGGLKEIAMDLGIPIIVLAQLSRESEKDGKPKTSHLRESGATEQDADAVGLLYRPKNKDNDANDKEYLVKLLLGKLRDGTTGEIELYFKRQFTRFYKVSKLNDEDQNP